jgi:hypothetical protein
MESQKDFQKTQSYKSDEFLSISMSFLIELQKEVLFQIGQKVQEKSMEQSTIYILTSNLTESIFKNAIIIKSEIQTFLLRMNSEITKHFKEKEIQKIEEEEKKSAEQKEKEKEKEKKAGDKKKEEKRPPTTEELIKDENLRLWEEICKKFIDQVFFSQILSMQINALSLLSTNFLIAAKTLKHISTFLTSLNNLYNTRKLIDKTTHEKVSMFFTEKSETFECEHPYGQKIQKKERIHIPGAKQLRIVFDPKCDLKHNCDYLQFFSDDKQKDKITEKSDGPGEASTFPKESLKEATSITSLQARD